MEEKPSLVLRTLKPFAEEEAKKLFVHLVKHQSLSSLFSLVDAGDGKTNIRIGPGNGWTELPLEAFLAVLTGATGAFHITLKNKPLEWFINEIIDIIGPALRRAADDVRSFTPDEIKGVNIDIEKQLKQNVLIVREADKYCFHHANCVSPEVATAIRDKRSYKRTLKDAIDFEIGPVVGCVVCSKLIKAEADERVKKSEKIKEEKEMGEQKKRKMSPAEIMRGLSVPDRNTIMKFIEDWKAEDPKFFDERFESVWTELDSKEEAEELARCKSLEQFKIHVLYALAPKTAVASAKSTMRALGGAISGLVSRKSAPDSDIEDLELPCRLVD